MSKFLIRFLCIVFLSLSTFAYAQEESEKPQSAQEQPDNQLDFFGENSQAPVSYKGAFFKMMITLLGLIVLIVISVWMLRRISHGRMKQLNAGRAIKILERRPLSAKSALYLIDIEGKKVVVSESQLEVRPITGGELFRPEDD